jgi:hypothetical protein
MFEEDSDAAEVVVAVDPSLAELPFVAPALPPAEEEDVVIVA